MITKFSKLVTFPSGGRSRKPVTTVRVKGYNKLLNPPKHKISTSMNWEE